MEESQDILLNSIASSGVTIPSGVSSVKDLTPPTLFAVSSQALYLIDRQNSSFPASLPENSVADRSKLCSELASAFKSIGFVGDISFHKFLYPSEEDLYELIRFLVGRLSDDEARKELVRESKRVLKTPEEKLDDAGLLPRKGLSERQVDPLMRMTQTPEASKESDLIPNKMEEVYNGVEIPIEGGTGSSNGTSSGEQDVLDLVEGVRRSSLRDGEQNFEYGQGQQSTSPCEHLPQTNCKTETLRDQKEMLVENSVSSSVQLQELQEKLDLLKAAVEMASDHKHPSDFYVNQLNDQVEVKRGKIVEMESHCIDRSKALEQKKVSLEEKLRATNPETYEKYKKVEEIELKLENILAENKRREEELIVLSAKAEKQPKLQPRRTYIQRVEEITKNSRKQDVDIERILKETRELQLESNFVQERLNRTRAVVDETVFREVKKDQVGEQAYRILTNIHDSFEQIAENLLATDRTRREVTDYEDLSKGKESVSNELCEVEIF
nr:coiled-coil domain-containing protein 22 homolog isoform X2 [Solanum lycopersicum]